MQKERFNPSSILRQHPDLERHSVEGLASIDFKTRAYGIDLDLQHMIRKPLLRHQALDGKMDEVFDLAVSTCSLLLGESLKGKYKMIIDSYSLHSGCYIKTKDIYKASLLYDQIIQLRKVDPYSYDGIVLVNDRKLFEEVFYYTDKILGRKRYIDPYIFKANLFSIYMHELMHAAQAEKGVKSIASIFSEGIATFVEDVFMSALAPMSFRPKNKLVFETNDYFSGIKNLTLLGGLYFDRKKGQMLLKHLDHAASTKPEYYTRHRLGEVFSMAIHLTSMDLRRTVAAGFDMSKDDNAGKFNDAISILKENISNPKKHLK